MSIVYSIGARIAGGGIGTTAYHAIRGYYRNGHLGRVLCGSYEPIDIPADRLISMGLVNRGMRKLASLDPSHTMDYLDTWLYDLWASHRLERSQGLHVWGNFGLRTIRKAASYGMTIIVERASTHPVYQQRLLREEYLRWGIPYPNNNLIIERALKEMALADFILVPSDFARSTFLEAGIPAEKILTVNFGVALERFNSGNRRTGNFRILFMGNVGIRKGVLYLLEAWKQLGWADAELWIAGRPESHISNLLRPYRRLPGVCYIGHTRQPEQLFSQVDLFAFPTLEEGSALVTYEAMASGLPVVTTPNAGAVIRDELDGYLVPIRDVDGLATRLEQLRSNPKLRLEMGTSARLRALQFSWDAYSDNLSRMVQAILAH